jgi:hypothetical protein
MAGDTVIAALKKGSEVKVAKVSGNWIAVDAVVKGTHMIGWINVADLQVKPINVGDRGHPGAPESQTVKEESRRGK